MSNNNNLEVVCHSPLGAELTHEECQVLSAVANLRHLDAGQHLIDEGQIDHALHVLVSGALEVSRDVGGGDWVSLHVLRPGEFAGAMGFIDGREHSATLRAIGPVQVLSLEREAFEVLLDTHPKLVYKVMRGVIRAVHQITARMNSQYVELANYISKQHGRY